MRLTCPRCELEIVPKDNSRGVLSIFPRSAERSLENLPVTAPERAALPLLVLQIPAPEAIALLDLVALAGAALEPASPPFPAPATAHPPALPRKVEIERKFLVRGVAYRTLGQPVPIRQGFLRSAADCVVRVRRYGSEAFLTFKGPNRGAVRSELEYALQPDVAERLLEDCAEPGRIDKLRYTLPDPAQGITWEVDEFLGDNQGLVVAEVELTSESQEVVLPEWLRWEDEVTFDPRYYNSNLSRTPFRAWRPSGKENRPQLPRAD